MHTDDLHLTSFNSFDQVLSNVDSTTINETSKKLIINEACAFRTYQEKFSEVNE